MARRAQLDFIFVPITYCLQINLQLVRISIGVEIILNEFFFQAIIRVSTMNPSYFKILTITITSAY